MSGVLPQQTDACCWQGHVLSHFCLDLWGRIQAPQGGQSLPPPSHTVLLSHCFLPYKYVVVNTHVEVKLSARICVLPECPCAQAS